MASLIFNWKLVEAESRILKQSSEQREPQLNYYYYYFKLVHRILVSKKELRLFGVSNNSNCTYCGQPDSISHTFIECHHSKQFFQNVLQHFNEENATSFTQSDEELLFGKSLNTIGQLQRPPLLKK